MNHTATPSVPDERDSALTPGPLANPRRTRLGADGRPIGDRSATGEATAA